MLSNKTNRVLDFKGMVFPVGEEVEVTKEIAEKAREDNRFNILMTSKDVETKEMDDEETLEVEEKPKKKAKKKKAKKSLF